MAILKTYNLTGNFTNGLSPCLLKIQIINSGSISNFTGLNYNSEIQNQAFAL